MGEGAGMLLVESLDSALARNAKIYAELAGFGTSDDAHHVVAPLESGEGMASSMSRALKDAGLPPEAVDYVSAHGTSTLAGDIGETRALHTVFGDHAAKLSISAIKSQIGHLLGAAGGAASVFAAKSLQTGMVPGTINLETPDPECDLNYLPNGSVQIDPKCVMVNSFGFGGTNASLVLKKW